MIFYPNTECCFCTEIVAEEKNKLDVTTDPFFTTRLLVSGAFVDWGGPTFVGAFVITGELGVTGELITGEFGVTTGAFVTGDDLIVGADDGGAGVVKI